MSAVIAVAQVKRLGRFELLSELGRGAQGTVFLARDPRLDRSVALKTLRLGGDGAGTVGRVKMLLDEARIVSRLQHTNIVTLFDAGEEGGVPFLVFEYVEGRTLSHLISAGPRPPITQCIDIAIGILRGTAFAHDMQVLHRDLKPANIMLTERGTPRIMDFGIACQASGSKSSEGGLIGTPSYMAPECVSEQIYVAASDVYSIGVILYELLTGAPPVSGSNVYEVLHKIANSPFDPPSKGNPEVDERLDALVMRALAKRPEERFANAEDMARALSDYLVPSPDEGSGPGADSNGTLEFLLRRIRHKSDFPALGNTISAINRVTASDREPVSVLCNAILKDVALTSKLLKVVNAACFGQFGGTISTVSRAVAVLGFEAVRSISTSLLLFENLQNKGQAQSLQEETASTYFSALMAAELVRTLGIRRGEEAFICTMFHRLGRLLVTFYLHEDKQAIDGLAQSNRWDEDRAAKDVLGISYEEIGIGVARQWNFPEEIIASMRPFGTQPLTAAGFEDNRLRVVAEMSTRLCDVMRLTDEKQRSAQIEGLVAQFGKAVGVTKTSLNTVIKGAVESFSRDAETLGAPMRKSRIIEIARGWEKSSSAEAQARPTRLDDTTVMMAQTQLIVAGSAEHAGVDAGTKLPVDENRQALLSAGVQDITNVLLGDYVLNDVLRIILETMYRGIGFQRMLLFIRDQRQSALCPRFGFGADIDAIIRSGFSIPLESSKDVFFAAVEKGADICIEDVDAEKIRQYVPDWYRKAIPARGLVLFPLRINGKPLALIYGDADSPERLRFKPDELNLLKTLRNQAVMAVKQKS